MEEQKTQLVTNDPEKFVRAIVGSARLPKRQRGERTGVEVHAEVFGSARSGSDHYRIKAGCGYTGPSGIPSPFVTYADVGYRQHLQEDGPFDASQEIRSYLEDLAERISQKTEIYPKIQGRRMLVPFLD